MKANVILMSCTLLLIVGGASNANAKDNFAAKAVVKKIYGHCYYQTGNSWSPVRVNAEYGPGVVFRTTSKATLDLSVNGLSSALRIEPDTLLAIPQIEKSGPNRDADVTTVLDLRKGAILGDVKKLYSNSRYEIRTPHGVAGMSKTPADFHVIATPQPDDKNEVTFTSVTGEMLVSAQAMPNGANVVKTLKEGRSWTPGEGDIHRTSRDLMRQYQAALTGQWSFDGPAIVQGPGILDPFAGAGQPTSPASPAALAVPGNAKK
jgi:hypothetical protein